jgi:hypothetical protein
MTRPRLLTLVVLGLVCFVVSALGEAASRRLHVTSQVVQGTFTGDPDNPQLGDRSIGNSDVFDERGVRVGTAVAVCTIISVPPLDTRDECRLTAELAEGQIIYGGVAPTWALVRAAEVGSELRWGILGGTGEFRTARGEVMSVVVAAGSGVSPGVIDTTFDLDLD